MIRKLMGLALFVSLSVSAAHAQQLLPNDTAPLAFTHVTVIDATGSPAQPDMTVVVADHHITAIGKTGQVTVPRNAVVTNAQGKFMIPGLWEMHGHPFTRTRKFFPLYEMYLFLTNGVTGARDMGDPLGERDDFGDYQFLHDLEWRQAIEAGAILGPRLNLALTILNGPYVPGYPRHWTPISNPEEGRAEVDYLKKMGADLIKVYDQLSRDSYYAIADEAKKQGIPFAGHVPILISAAEASDAGQRSLEHDYAVLFGCSSIEQELMQKENALYGTGKPTFRGNLPPDDVKALVGSYSDSKANALFAKFVKNNTFVTPSLVRAAVDHPGVSDPRVKYFPPAFRDYYFPPAQANRKPPDPAVVESLKMMYAYHERIVKAMQAAGVKLLPGTDSQFFGSAVHDEMAAFVKAGLTPMQALQTATRNSADYLGKLDILGTVEKGKLADLVLLDANPLENIENVRKVQAVVIDGRLLDRKTLDRMLSLVQSTNDQTLNAYQ